MGLRILCQKCWFKLNVGLDYYSVIGYARDIETTTGEKFIAMKVDNPPTTYIPNITVSLNLDTNELNVHF